MATVTSPGVMAGRLSQEEIAANFADLHPPLSGHEALVAADRCYFCHDAPCATACPTTIDIPLFIRQIATGAVEGAAKTIFSQNILGGMCARVCPTEQLCEEACVRQTAEDRPVEIGRLQRFATDRMMEKPHPFQRAAPTGRRVAVVGAGPAGLACAHRLAMKGHDVTIYDAREKPGGLNEYGIAAYKTVDGFAQAEVDWLLQIGGIEIREGAMLERDITLHDLRARHDAVFLGVGLAGVNALSVAGSDQPKVQDAVGFIAALRQSDNLACLPVGRNVVVIGGGMTAIDAAVQAKKLGAENVTLVYRRERARMNASRYEQDLAATAGVKIIANAAPKAVNGATITFAYTENGPDGLIETGESFEIPADEILTAIGQSLGGVPTCLTVENGKIVVTGPGRTSIDGVWAGGDCASGGDDLTVTAVAEGRDAAEDIHARLTGG